MKYLCLVYLDDAHWSACPDQECFEFAKELAASGRLVAAEPLHPGHTATTVRLRNGQTALYDGPFAETKELLAGFYLIDRRNMAASKFALCGSSASPDITRSHPRRYLAK